VDDGALVAGPRANGGAENRAPNAGAPAARPDSESGVNGTTAMMD
jgi:hypothetical protein